MGLIRKVIKYGIVFALGYYLGSGGCTTNYDKKYSNLEQEVLKYEQKNIGKGPEYARVVFEQP